MFQFTVWNSVLVGESIRIEGYGRVSVKVCLGIGPPPLG